ncbi:MAG: DNA alkylation repair protein [Anaerolineales bacterium]
MKTKEARELGGRIAALVQAGQIAAAYDLLSPVLAERTRFVMLRHIGAAAGVGPLQAVNDFMERVAAEKTIGGWVVIASALEQQLERDLAGAFDRCRDFVIFAEVWHAADTLGEGVVGQALVACFDPALALLKPWREHGDPWVRRAVGTGVHYWAKRSRGATEQAARAEMLLALLEPMFEEWDIKAVKGIGWGLKTLGRLYPDLVADWLRQQVVHRQRRHRAIMLRKALTYLPDEQRARATGK